jgi:hypothetical protein
MKEVTVNTIQGIGDTLWVYRKLSPLYDKINFNIIVVDDSKVQQRSKDFLLSLDKTKSVNFSLAFEERYHNLVSSYGVIKDEPVYDYSVNAWLETGTHINNIDSNPVDWDINLKVTPVDNLPEKYLLVYISGSSRHDNLYQLTDDHWMKLIISTAILKGLDEIIFIGAEYDRWKISAIVDMLKPTPLKCQIMLLDLPRSCYIIKNAEYFIAYQSGLCMLAEELGTETFMVWYPMLLRMQTTWIRPENIEKRLFRHGYFNQSFNGMMNTIKE